MNLWQDHEKHYTQQYYKQVLVNSRTTCFSIVGFLTLCTEYKYHYKTTNLVLSFLHLTHSSTWCLNPLYTREILNKQHTHFYDSRLVLYNSKQNHTGTENLEQNTKMIESE